MPTLPSSPPLPDIAQVLKRVRIAPGKPGKPGAKGARFRLRDHDCAWVPVARGKSRRGGSGLDSDELLALDKDEIKDRAKDVLRRNVEELAAAQELLWASNDHAVLVVFQAMDAAGKDGTIKHVTSGLNPAGCEVTSFKAPTPEELDHTFLWRVHKRVPERGKIGIFNRSHYEDVLIVRVHPELLGNSKLAIDGRGEKLWAQRYEDINAFERHLARNGTVILKFFLNVSKEEQRKRLLARLNDPEKNWKFNSSDLDTRDKWDDYMRAYEQAIAATSTPWAPWHVIPADHKWVMRAMVASIITHTIRSLDLRFPKLTLEQQRGLAAARKRLGRE
ncbi:MAG: polyphosphate kinase 2 family protein [Phycisphaeraceae bacterium]|nr:polyphosphate kinase 2 family protein [Phycisphaeraceae bacterium]